MKVIVSPHPDDAEVGLGAAIVRWRREKIPVTVVVLTGEGDLTMVHSRQTIPFAQRQQEQMRAAQILDFEVMWANFSRAAMFDTQPLGTLVSALDVAFARLQPTDVYTLLPAYAQDHDIPWKATLAAFRPGKLDNVALWGYEQAANVHGVSLFGPLVGKQYIVTDKDGVDLQMKALACHASQMDGREDTLVGNAGLETLARLRGMECGREYATLVYPIRSVV